MMEEEARRTATMMDLDNMASKRVVKDQYKGKC